MKIYLSGMRASQAQAHSVYICPARHLEGQDLPSEFYGEDGEPLNIEVKFTYGMAEVPSNIGRYMLESGLASKTLLIIPDGVKAA